MKQKIMSVFMAATLMAGANQPVAPSAAIRTASASANVVSVALGSSHSAAVLKNGGLYCWGSNDAGQVGNNSDEQQDKPVKVLDNVVQAALGTAHSAAITGNGDLYCWGSNDNGQLGDGSGEDQPKPVKVLSNAKSVSLGNTHSLAVAKNGDLYCWGSNVSGQLGDGTGEDQPKPVKVLSNVKSAGSGEAHSAVVTKSGVLYCWGSNDSGQLGDATGDEQDKPVKISINASSSSGSVRVGYATTVKKLNYEVIKVNANGTGEVALKGTSNKKSSKSFKSLKVVDSIKINGKAFKVTSVSSNSFSGYKNLQTVVVGKNVTSIGKKAFNNCKKVTKLTINSSKLKSVGDKAISGINKKAKIKVPKSSLKSYKKLFKSKSGYKKTMKISK